MPDVYREGFKIPADKVEKWSASELKLARRFRTNTNSFYLPQVSRLIVWTEYCKADYLRRRLIDADRIDVIPSFLPDAPAPAKRRETGELFRIGFAALQFEAKGGKVLLEAFRRVRRRLPSATLVVVGCGPPDSDAAREAGVEWLGKIPRDELLTEIMPSFHVFAYPTQYDCISYVALEAMRLGIPMIVSDYPSMPEVVAHGRAGLISRMGDSEALAGNILRLLEPDANRRFGEAARRQYQSVFSAEAVRPKLMQSYVSACDTGVNEPEESRHGS